MPERLKYIITPFALILVCSAVAYFIYKSKPEIKPTSPEISARLIRVMEAKPEDVTMKLTSQGIVTPRTESALVSQVPGLIQSVAPSFVAGGFFEKGDILIKLDPSDYEFLVIKAKQQVAQAKLALQLEEQQGQLARAEWGRLNNSPLPPLVARQPQLAQAKAAFEASRAGLRQAELNLERTRIRAPFAGRIRKKNADVGQYLTPGLSVALIYAIDYAEVRLPLSDRYLAFLDMDFDFRGSLGNLHGPKVELHAEFAGAKYTWPAYLTRIEAEVDSRSRMIHVVARADNPYGKGSKQNRPPLAVGLFVEADIEGKQYRNIFQVPREAIRLENKVLVVQNEAQLFSREVEVLRLDAEKAYISSGLQRGDLICLSNLDTFVEGMRIEPTLNSNN